VGQAEAEVDADPEHLKEAIELIPAVAAKLPGPSLQVFQSPLVQTEQTATTEPTISDQPPLITVEKGDSLADLIWKFFSGPWGREKRKLSDVRTALQSYGMNYPKQSVAVALLRLAKASKIRRFKAEDGEFVYTSSIISASSGTVPTLELTQEPIPNEIRSPRT